MRLCAKLARTLENVAPAAPLLLLTATAPPSVLGRAHTAFGMGPRDILRAPLDRPNLRYEVIEVPQKDPGNTICMCCGTGCYLCLSFIPRLALAQGRALLGRVLIGVVAGVATGVVPVYLAELSPVQMRGAIVSALPRSCGERRVESAPCALAPGVRETRLRAGDVLSWLCARKSADRA